MMLSKQQEPNSVQGDAEWILQSLAGSREAFARIVQKYQSLVCSLGYSATGSLVQSEDIAQETFVVAWKNLHQLREPEKLRPWLCSIARSVISGAARRERRQPAQGAEPLESAEEASAAGPIPSEAVIAREEEGILWRALGRLPERYREPLILFYREEQSISRVAEQLELSEEAVRQRLSRGRKLLSEEVTASVEGWLRRTRPGKTFTLAVIAALPAFTVSASAASLGAAAAKNAVAAKAAISAGLTGAILGPLLGIIGGWLGAKLSIENTESPRERRFMVRMSWLTVILAVGFCLAIGGWNFALRAWGKTHPVAVGVGLVGLLLVYGATLTVLIVWGNRRQRLIRAEETAKRGSVSLPPEGLACPAPAGEVSREYRSRWTFLGLPLIHVRVGGRREGRILPAKGWIAIGEVAYGALFGCGSAFAMAPISLGGGGAVGLLAVAGGAAAGVASMGGGFSFGLWALGGGLAIGQLALGGCALGWTWAQGGVALARDFAVGGFAWAHHANDLAARAFLGEGSARMHLAGESIHPFYFAALVGAVVIACWVKARRGRGRRDDQ